MKITIDPLEPGDLKPFPTELGFGRNFSNRMFSQRYTPDQGWHDARIGPYRPLTLDPATVVFHYGQEIFEGLKAYRRPDGKINLFRPWENAARFNRSAERMAMAQVDPEEHVEAIAELVSLEHEWVPDPARRIALHPADPDRHGYRARCPRQPQLPALHHRGPSGTLLRNGLRPGRRLHLPGPRARGARGHRRRQGRRQLRGQPLRRGEGQGDSGISRCSGWMQWIDVMSRRSVR